MASRKKTFPSSAFLGMKDALVFATRQGTEDVVPRALEVGWRRGTKEEREEKSRGGEEERQLFSKGKRRFRSVRKEEESFLFRLVASLLEAALPSRSIKTHLAASDDGARREESMVFERTEKRGRREKKKRESVLYGDDDFVTTTEKP